jgi:hypothetical protein
MDILREDGESRPHAARVLVQQQASWRALWDLLLRPIDETDRPHAASNLAGADSVGPAAEPTALPDGRTAIRPQRTRRRAA